MDFHADFLSGFFLLNFGRLFRIIGAPSDSAAGSKGEAAVRQDAAAAAGAAAAVGAGAGGGGEGGGGSCKGVGAREAIQ